MNFKKAEFVAAVAARTGLTRADSESAVAAVLDVIATEVAGGKRVGLPGFGTFQRKFRVARPAGRTATIPRRREDAPADWAPFEWRTLGPLISRDGAFGETAFCHRPTGTLLVTDTVVEVTKEVPRILEEDGGAALRYHARDTVAEVVGDTRAVRERGWRRIVLFGLFFTPAAIKIKDTPTALKERRPDVNPDFAG